MSSNDGQVRDEDLRWRLSLDKKERLIQQDISARHLVEGTCVPTVPIPADGRPVDHTTTGNTGDMHASSWTGCYLVAAAFRYAWAKENGSADEVESAFRLGETLVHGIDVLTHVSGVPGLLARKVVYGHGPAVEERIDNNSRNEWHQGVGQLDHLRFRGHPSHHNYHHVIRGLGLWYYFLRKENPEPSDQVRAQMEKVRKILTEMMEFGYKAHDLTLMTVDGRVSANLIFGVREGRPSTTGLMATNSLKIAHWITGDPWYGEKYEELVSWFGYRTAGEIPPDGWQRGYRGSRAPDHDDTEHTLASLWLVHQIEDDPQLKAFYKMATNAIFQSKKNEKRSPFNYYYASVTGDVEGADLAGALETLRLYPSVTLTYPMMNSIRADIDVEAKPLLPFNQQPLDNAYDWKGDPYTLDRWLSRPVTSLAVSDEDPSVWYLADTSGALYRSLDGGSSFSVAEIPWRTSVRSVTFAGNKSRIALLATDRGLFRTDTGGYMNNWERVKVGHAEMVDTVILDSANPNMAWCIADGEIYRSVNLGFEEVGKAWERVFGPMPAKAKAVPRQGSKVVYGLATGPEPEVYAALGGRLYHRSVHDEGWSGPVDIEDYHVIPTYHDIVVSPHDPSTAIGLVTMNVWGRDFNLVLRTVDGGSSVTAVGWNLPRSIPPSEGSGLEWQKLTSVAFDSKGPDILYGASERGVHRSLDGGRTWVPANDGLRIPYAYGIFAPKESPEQIYVSTPAGLQISTDQGETWGGPVLVLNGPGVNRTERGGMGYLAAYWPGRYFGFVTDEQARSRPESW